MHWGLSFIDFLTSSLSGHLPHGFLRGCGLPDTLINYLPSFQGNPIQFYSCFISYSTRDQVFAERLHADLQNKSVGRQAARPTQYRRLPAMEGTGRVSEEP
jgi:hypothetical protein